MKSSNFQPLTAESFFISGQYKKPFFLNFATKKRRLNCNCVIIFHNDLKYPKKLMTPPFFESVAVRYEKITPIQKTALFCVIILLNFLEKGRGKNILFTKRFFPHKSKNFPLN
jgi:hypothetical protein